MVAAHAIVAGVSMLVFVCRDGPRRSQLTLPGPTPRRNEDGSRSNGPPGRRGLWANSPRGCGHRRVRGTPPVTSRGRPTATPGPRLTTARETQAYSNAACRATPASATVYTGERGQGRDRERDGGPPPERESSCGSDCSRELRLRHERRPLRHPRRRLHLRRLERGLHRDGSWPWWWYGAKKPHRHLRLSTPHHLQPQL